MLNIVLDEIPLPIKFFSYTRSPFQIQSFFKDMIYPYPEPDNPCFEILLTQEGWCRLGYRPVSSPFELTDFEEFYYVN